MVAARQAALIHSWRLRATPCQYGQSRPYIRHKSYQGSDKRSNRPRETAQATDNGQEESQWYRGAWCMQRTDVATRLAITKQRVHMCSCACAPSSCASPLFMFASLNHSTLLCAVHLAYLVALLHPCLTIMPLCLQALTATEELAAKSRRQDVKTFQEQMQALAAAAAALEQGIQTSHEHVSAYCTHLSCSHGRVHCKGYHR